MAEDRLILLRAFGQRLLTALTSRRVLVAISALVVGIITLKVPELTALHDELLVLVISLALMLIGGFSVDEAARIGRDRASQPPQELREQIKLLLAELLDEMLDARKEKRDG